MRDAPLGAPLGKLACGSLSSRAPVAQWIEQEPSNLLVVGSIPTGGAFQLTANLLLMDSFLLLTANAFSMVLPLLGSGLALIFAIRKRVFESLNLPLDGGLKLGAEPLIGRSKTWRGLLIHVVVATAITVGLNALAQLTDFISPLYKSNPFVVGPLVAIAYVTGEVINSFIKRRLRIAPGTTTQSRFGSIIQKFFDNTDGILVVGLLMIFVYRLPAELLAACFVLSILAHESTDALMRSLKLKKKQ